MNSFELFSDGAYPYKNQQQDKMDVRSPSATIAWSQLGLGHKRTKSRAAAKTTLSIAEQESLHKREAQRQAQKQREEEAKQEIERIKKNPMIR